MNLTLDNGKRGIHYREFPLAQTPTEITEQVLALSDKRGSPCGTPKQQAYIRWYFRTCINAKDPEDVGLYTEHKQSLISFIREAAKNRKSQPKCHVCQQHTMRVCGTCKQPACKHHSRQPGGNGNPWLCSECDPEEQHWEAE
jgi:hypothetical protein